MGISEKYIPCSSVAALNSKVYCLNWSLACCCNCRYTVDLMQLLSSYFSPMLNVSTSIFLWLLVCVYWWLEQPNKQCWRLFFLTFVFGKLFFFFIFKSQCSCATVPKDSILFCCSINKIDLFGLFFACFLGLFTFLLDSWMHTRI